MLMATPSKEGFRVVGSFSRIVRLGEGLSASGRLGEAAMGRTIDALKVCAGKIRDVKARRVHAIATEACRRAANSGPFVERVEAETGIVLEIVSAKKESELTLRGCVPLLDTSTPFALITDIGGGSTELMWIDLPEDGPPRLIDLKSIPFGVVTLADRYGCDSFSAKDYASMMALADPGLSDFDAEHSISREISRGRVQMLGTSGTVTMLGGLYLNLERYNRSKVDGLDMDPDTVVTIASRLAAMDGSERAAIPCIGRQRAELAVGGCAFLEAILRRWPAPRLRAADRGIREGLLLGMMSEHGAS